MMQARRGTSVRRISRITIVAATAIIASLLSVDSASAIATESAGYAWGDFDADGFGDLAVGAPGEAIGSSPVAGAVHVFYGTDAGLAVGGNQLWTQDSDGVSGRAEKNDGFGAALAAGDFNDDGRDDLAIGAPGEKVGTAAGAGAVTILFGTASDGLKAAGNQSIVQGGSGIGGTAETDDLFGFAMAAADYDGDGRTGLAIGAPGESIGSSLPHAGAVTVLDGTASGDLAAPRPAITQDSAGVAGAAEEGDLFGWSLSTGDYDADGFPDLTVGTPFETIGSDDFFAGIVNAFFGSDTDITTTGSKQLTQSGIGTGSANPGDLFGWSLASGTFDVPRGTEGDYDDLAIGVPGEMEGSGEVDIVDGGPSPFVDDGESWYQSKAGLTGTVAGSREPGDGFGLTLAANDFNGDDRADLAVGAPGESTSVKLAGAVHVLYSGPAGIDPGVGPDAFWTQNTAGIQGAEEVDDEFGLALGSGDFSDDGVSELVIGTALEDHSGARDAGTITVVAGNPDGPMSAETSKLFHQGTTGVKGTPERDDLFGGAFG